MAQWEDLTEEQQSIVSAWMDQLLRPVAGEIARVLHHLDVTKSAYTSSVLDVLALLDNGATIPNSSGLAGALPLTKSELQPMLSALNGLLADYYSESDQELYVILAGGPNVIGG